MLRGTEEECPEGLQGLEDTPLIRRPHTSTLGRGLPTVICSKTEDSQGDNLRSDRLWALYCCHQR